MFYDAVTVRHVHDYVIEIEFSNGERGYADLSCISRTGVFERFTDLEYFKRVYINEGALTWPPGDIDLAPEFVYEQAVGKPLDIPDVCSAHVDVPGKAEHSK